MALAELERLAIKGEAELIKFLRDETGRSEKSLKRALDSPVGGDAARKLRAACGNDEALFSSVLPFSGLVRYDTCDRLAVIRKGSVFVTAGTDRRSSGTHYTPRSLTEPIVQYTLEPLVYFGPAEGKSKEEWKLRTAKELLDLKVCDMACGSGAFLVQACRYLSERLVEAWEEAESGHLGVPSVVSEGAASAGVVSEQLIPRDSDERLAYARRSVAQRCLYGVDKNPLAAEMAKLSLWLLTLAKNKPFTFLDHAIRCGDSLVGIRDIRQVQYFQLDLDQADRSLFAGPVMSLVEEAASVRKELESLPANTVEDVREMQRLLADAEDKTARLCHAADLLISVEFQPVSSAGEKDDLHNSVAIQAGHYVQSAALKDFRVAAEQALGGQATFHWPLAFPEVVVERGGFDAFVCNPPFLGGKRISTMHGAKYERFLKSVITRKKGAADLCAYFFIRVFSLLRNEGNFGLLATNTIAQTDTREIGLLTVEAEGAITKAVPSMAWPGAANVIVALVHAHKGAWHGPFILNDSVVCAINSYLSSGDTLKEPYRLALNKHSCFGTKGTYVHGKGFVISAEEARDFIQQDNNNAAILMPYLVAQDFTTDPEQRPSRFVINFGDMNRQEAMNYRSLWDHLVCTVQPIRDALKGQIHEKCFWKFWDRRDDLYDRASQLGHVLVCPEVSKYSAFALVINKYVFSSMVNVVASDSTGLFACVQSSVHGTWAWHHGSTMKTDLRYTTSDCLDTFPFPENWSLVDDIGERYHFSRHGIMVSHCQGLTRTYNRFHDESESNADIRKLRRLHVEMDTAVAATYGWTDLNFDHGFHETKQGNRFTISESARREVLARLLTLNHERYAKEVKQGLHDKKTKAKPASSGRGRISKASPSAPSLNFGDDEDEPDRAAATDDEGADTASHAEDAASRAARADCQIAPAPAADDPPRPVPIDQIETDAVMAAFRQAARGRGRMERDELLKEVSLILGYQRLGPRIVESLRGHLRAAIRRGIIEAEGPSLVRAGTGTMSDYGLEALRETFRSVMRQGTNYDREDLIHSLAHHLGFVRVTDTIREPIKSAINSAIRQGLLGCEGTAIWRIS